MTETCNIENSSGCPSNRPCVRRFKFFAFLLLLIAVLSVPWKEWGAAHLKSMLEDKGYQDVSLNLSAVGFTESAVTDIVLGGDVDLTVERLYARYSLSDYMLHFVGLGDAPEIGVRAEKIVVKKGDYVVAAPLAFIDIKLGQSVTGKLRIPRADMPFLGGRISAQRLTVPLEEPRTIKAWLNLHHVSVASLLGMITGMETAATGTISGVLPVTIEGDGAIHLDGGTLRSLRTGKIMLPPEAIPGSHKQVTFVRKILSNFHYDLLSIDMNSQTNQELKVGLHLEGRNPDVMKGRKVKLNVNLTGDMINMIQQNLAVFADPHKLLKRGQDE